MTPEAQRIAIARSLGWEHLPKDDETIQYVAQMPDGTWDLIPDYPNDLNAMHEAAITLPIRQEYWWELCDVVGADTYDAACEPWKVFDATAAQRAEAYLKTLNLWK